MNAPFRHAELELEPDLEFVLPVARVSSVPVAFNLGGQWLAYIHVYQPGETTIIHGERQ